MRRHPSLLLLFSSILPISENKIEKRMQFPMSFIHLFAHRHYVLFWFNIIVFLFYIHQKLIFQRLQILLYNIP